ATLDPGCSLPPTRGAIHIATPETSHRLYAAFFKNNGANTGRWRQCPTSSSSGHSVRGRWSSGVLDDSPARAQGAAAPLAGHIAAATTLACREPTSEW